MTIILGLVFAFVGLALGVVAALIVWAVALVGALYLSARFGRPLVPRRANPQPGAPQ